MARRLHFCCYLIRTRISSSINVKGGGTTPTRDTAIDVVILMPSSEIRVRNERITTGLRVGTEMADPTAALFYFRKKVVVTVGVPGETALGTLAVHNSVVFPTVAPDVIPGTRPKDKIVVTP